MKYFTIPYLIGSTFIFFSTIPWFGLPQLDSQPFPLIFALLFLFIVFYDQDASFKTPSFFIHLVFIFCLGVVIGLFFIINLDFLIFRGIINYIGIPLYLIAFYEFIKRYGFPFKILVISNLIWLLIAVLQLYVPDIVTLFVAQRTTIGRGVTSLAPEPSYFAIYLFFISWVYLLATKYKPSKGIALLISLNFISIFLLAKSLMVATFFLVVGLVIILVNFPMLLKNFKKVLLLVSIILISTLMGHHFLDGSRISTIIKLMVSVDVWSYLMADASINRRLADVLLPFHGFIHNLGLPGGFHSFESVSAELADKYHFYRDLFWFGFGGNKIMSWNLSMLYEIGLFAIIFWVIVFKEMWIWSRKRLVELLILFVLLFSAIPLAFPIIPAIIALLYINKHYNFVFIPVQTNMELKVE